MVMGFPASPTVLTLDLVAALATLLPDARVEHRRFADLDAALLARLRPDRIMLPLMSQGHDALQVIERLQALGYGGLITVVAPSLPQARMVEAELRALGPGLRLTLITPGPPPWTAAP